MFDVSNTLSGEHLHQPMTIIPCVRCQDWFAIKNRFVRSGVPDWRICTICVNIAVELNLGGDVDEVVRCSRDQCGCDFTLTAQRKRELALRGFDTAHI